MRSWFLAAPIALVLLGMAEPVQAPPAPYRLVATVPLGAPDHWDFLAVEPSSHRVFIAHDTELTVVDGATGAVVGHVPGFARAHGIAFAPGSGRGFASSGKDGTVVPFDLATLSAGPPIAAAADTDAIVYDPAANEIVSANGDSGSLTFIDPGRPAAIATVKIGGSLEMMAVDGKGRLYVNDADGDRVVAVDTKTHQVVASFPVPGCKSPHGLAAGEGRLYLSCPAGSVVMLDAASGRLLGSRTIGQGTDSAGIDPGRKLVFSANSAGTLSIISVASPDRLDPVAELPTAVGARTFAEDQETGRVFLVTATVTGSEPPREPGGRPRPTFAPGSVKLLVLERAG